MELGMVEKYPDDALLANYSSIVNKVHDQAICDEEISCYSVGRSIADMLPPIKHSAANESLDEKHLTLLESPKDVLINGNNACLTLNTSYAGTEWETKPTLPVENYSLCPIVNEVSQEDGLNHASKYQTSDSTKEAVLETAKTELFSKTDGFATESEDQIRTENETSDVCSDKSFGEKSTSSRLDIQDLLSNYKELDTLNLARKVKEVLVANNIGQRIFGQAVLGLTQGSVSDLLSHPKSWQTLSLKGREPFVRMQMWLENPDNVKLIQNLKSEKNADNTGLGSSFTRPKRLSTKKKCRVVLSMDEKTTLLKAYSNEPYPSQATVQELSNKLGKNPSTIVNWFHNYRSRVKRGFFGSSDSLTSKQSQETKKSKNKTKISNEEKHNVTIDTPIQACEINPNKHEENKAENAKPPQENEVIKNKDNGMLLTATVLVGASPKPVSPLWTFRVSENNSLATPNGNLKTLIFNVCSTTRTDDLPNHCRASQENMAGEQ